MADPAPDLHLSTIQQTPYGWPYRQLRVPQAHRVTRGDPGVIVAVIDLGYVGHPHHTGHLWVNPRPTRGDIHGFDCVDDDPSLEPTGPMADTDYYRNHHTFVAGEVIGCAPECRVMIVRVGYENPESWWRGIDYAVEHGARVLVMPHGFLTHGPRGGSVPLFYRGTDMTYPEDNPRIRRALDDAYDAGCLIVRGTAENRGRRVAFHMCAVDSVIAVGSSNRHGRAANIATDADYVEVGAPGGQRGTDDPLDLVWSTGGGDGYVTSSGGCMAAGFAGGVAGLVCSRFPELSNEHVRQVLRNTAQGDAWDSRLGWGILDAAAAVSTKPSQLCQSLHIEAKSATVKAVRRKPMLSVTIHSRGAYDVEKAMLVAYNGDPRKAAAPRATMAKPQLLLTRQLGHTIAPVRGLSSAQFTVGLTDLPLGDIWLQVCTLDRHGSDRVDARRVEPPT
ncbi:MAG TPA: hypothetical protein DGT21_05045 [Armatimonadetes bacterium]|nr:hypothetical protein [Armatimonadota bacterium]